MNSTDEAAHLGHEFSVAQVLSSTCGNKKSYTSVFTTVTYNVASFPKGRTLCTFPDNILVSIFFYVMKV